MATHSSEDVGAASQEMARLLDELQLRGFIFTVEPKDDLWQLRVECATDGDWQVIEIFFEGAALLARLRDPSERETLKAELRDRLRGCAKSAGQ